MATTKSDLAARAAAVIPGGVNSGQRRVPGLDGRDRLLVRETGNHFAQPLERLLGHEPGLVE